MPGPSQTPGVLDLLGKPGLFQGQANPLCSLLEGQCRTAGLEISLGGLDLTAAAEARHHLELSSGRQDRKSTRLNSSHVAISYAVFCLKKKKKNKKKRKTRIKINSTSSE